MGIESMRSRELYFSSRKAICFIAALVSLDASGFDAICQPPALIAGEQTGFVSGRPLDDVTNVPVAQVAERFASYTHDLDQDGDTDIVLLGNWSPDLGDWDGEPREGRILINNGNYEFSVAKGEVPLSVFASSDGVLFADFDANGYIDFFIGDSGYDAPPFPGYQNGLMLQFEDGWVNASDRLPDDVGFTHDAAIADVDGDNDLDIFVLNIGITGEGRDRKYWLLNDGRANFELNQGLMPDSLPELYTFSDYWNVLASDVEDLDGDGYTDMVFGAMTEAGTLNRIFWGGPSGFSDDALTTLDLDDVIEAVELQKYQVDGVTIFDANRDGLPDIWISGGGLGEPNRFSQLWMNAGDRRFLNQTASRISSLANGVGKGRPVVDFFDFNGDGHEDIVPIYGPPTPPPNPELEAYVWLGDGKGFFTAVTGIDISPELGNLGYYYVRSPEEVYAFNTFPFNDTLYMGTTEILQTSRVKTYPCPLSVLPSLIPSQNLELEDELISTFR